MRVEPPVESPANLSQALALLAQDGSWRPVAGGTDLIVQMTGELGPPPERVLDVWRIPELRGIYVDSGVLTVGALTTYTQIRQSTHIREHLSALVEAAATIGAAQ